MLSYRKIIESPEMKTYSIIALSILLVLNISAQRTEHHGKLFRINYHSETLDTSSVGDWGYSSSSSGYNHFSGNHNYTNIFSYNNCTYALTYEYRDDYTGINATYGIEKFSTPTQKHYLQDNGYLDIVSPFAYHKTFIEFCVGGIRLLRGNAQQCFMKTENEEPVFSYFSFNTDSYLNIIAGKYKGETLAASGDYIAGELKYYQCTIDNDTNIVLEKEIFVDMGDNPYTPIYPTNFQQLKTNIYFSPADFRQAVIYKSQNDSLIITDRTEARDYYVFLNQLYLNKDNKIIKVDIDSTDGTISQLIPLETLTGYQVGFPVKGENATYWKDDTLKVFNLLTESVIYSTVLDPESFCYEPMIDSTYVYLHKIYSVTDLEDDNDIPVDYELSQNYPNPFNPTTRICYNIPCKANCQFAQHVTLTIYDILGNQIAAPVNEKQSPGNYEYVWKAADLASGVYFYRLVVKENNNIVFTQSNKMILLK